LYKRRFSLLLAFMMIFQMTVQPFSGSFVYAEENMEPALTAEEEIMETVEETEDSASGEDTVEPWEEVAGVGEEAAGVESPVSYNFIFYQKDGSNWKEISRTHVEVGKKISDYPSLVPSDPNPDKDTVNQLKFKGWGTDPSGPVYSFNGNDDIPSRNTDFSFYEVWKPYYVVTYDHNYDGCANFTREVDGGSNAESVSANSRDDYTFVRWCSNPECTIQYDFTTVLTQNITIYAQWKKKHDVTFYTITDIKDDNISIQHKKDGETIDDPHVSKTGYDFGGWFTSKDRTEASSWNFANTLSEDHPVDFKLYPKWTKQKRTVSFDYCGYGTNFSKEVDYDTAVSRPADPSENPGYKFDNWYQKSGDEFTSEWQFSSGVKTNMTLYAKFSPVVYAVEYNQNGKTAQGMPNEEKYKKVNLGGKILRPETDPTDTNETGRFTGWYTTADCKELWDFENHVVSKNDAKDGKIILYAGWETITYTVTFSSNVALDVASQSVNAKGWPKKPVKFSDGSLIEDYPGKLFIGWYKDKELKKYEYTFKETDDERITKDMVLFCKWEIANSVSFDSNGGSYVPSIKVVSGQPIEKIIKDPKKTGFTFDGWYKEPELINKWDFSNNSEVVDKDITLYAKWNVVYYYASFYDGKSKYPIDKKTVSYDGLIPETDKTVVSEGKIFNGWYKEPDHIKWDFKLDKMPAENVNLYPGWDDILYTVSFNTKAAGVSSPSAQMVPYDHTLVEPDVSREGYTLAGWYMDESFTTDKRWDFTTDHVKENMWLYANWLDKYCIVSFDTNGGSNISPSKVRYGKSLSVSAIPTKKGCVFKGWYRNKICTSGYEYDFSNPVITDFTLYAKWDSAPQVKVEVVCGSNGTADPRGDLSLDKGSSQLFRFIPDSGFEVDRLTDNGKEVALIDDTYTLENITGYHKLYVTFKKKPEIKYVISSSCADDNGTVTPIGHVYVAEGENQKFKFEPYVGFELDYVIIDGEKITVSNNYYIFENVTKGHTLVVYFREKRIIPPVPPGYHEVKFVVGDETIQILTVSDGAVVERPEDPYIKGQIFQGWFDGNSKWNFADPVTKALTLTAKFLSDTVSDGDIHSGLDDRMNISDRDDITMVKGQTYKFGEGIWSSTDSSVISVGKKNGVAKAKNPSNVRIILTDSSRIPAVSYKIKVLAPEISDKNVTMGVGSTQKISLLYSDGLNIAWTSSNPKIVSVEEGVISAKCKGNAKIYAWVNGKKYPCSVKVTDTFTVPSNFDNVTAFTIRPTQTLNLRNISVAGQKPNKLDWRLLDEATNRDVDKTGWLAWDDGVCRVDINGKLKAKTCGTSSLIGRQGDTRVKSIRVTVATIPTKTETYINVGKNERLSYYKVVNSKAYWDATNLGNIVKLGMTNGTKGRVYGLAVGTSVVSCSYNGMEYKTTVHVENPVPSMEDSRIGRLKENQYVLSLKTGKRFMLDMPEVIQQVIWTSADKNISFVDENGMVEGRKPGNTSLSAKINGTTVKVNVYVTE